MTSKGNFTKTGFSKSGFSCCSHYAVCDMGRKDCFYEQMDPEVKTYCNCYQRNQSKDKDVDREKNAISREEVEDELEVASFEEGQLSLF